MIYKLRMRISAAIFHLFLISAISVSYKEAAAIRLDSEMKNDSMELSMVVEITRHGERASQTVYEGFTDGPNFQVKSKELTETGALSHFTIGRSLRQEFGQARFMSSSI